MLLNPRQREAIRYTQSPMLVLAGAGSGKTRVITEKIVYLIKEYGLKAHQICAVTFTNKAAREMKERIGKSLPGGETRGLRVSTFHTLGLNILKREHKHLGYKSGFTIYDAEESLHLIKELLRQQSDSIDIAPDIQHEISRWKNNRQSANQALATAKDDWAKKAALYYAGYQDCLKAYNAVDFDDLILLPTQLFAEHSNILLQWQQRIRYLLVDEYQDTNGAQYELIKLLLGDRDGLTVVGDDDQSIYAWRGARPENMKQLTVDYPRLKVVKLEQNYRSLGRILKAANHVIDNNPHVFEKKLWSEMGYGEPLRVIRCTDSDHEAEKVAAEILHHKFVHNTKFTDYAILYRGNHQSRLFEKALRQQRIPYQLTGGTSFFAYTEVKDLLSYLKLICNPDDNGAFLRVVNTPRREIGATTLHKLQDYAEQRKVSLFTACGEIGLSEVLPERAVNALNSFAGWVGATAKAASALSPQELMKQIVVDIGYEAWLMDTSKDPNQADKRLNNVNELIDWLEKADEKADDEAGLQDHVSRIALLDILDRQSNDEPDNDAIHMMTLHAAKGLEFPHVYMVSMEEEVLPHKTSLEEGDVEEERRLAYVGITRAQHTLTFTLAYKRKRYGEVSVREPSRFLYEIPEDDLQWHGEGEKVDEAAAKSRGSAHLANLKDLLK